MNTSAARYFKIGLFVALAVVLAVAGLTILGMGTLFEKKIMVETYLDQSVQGLEVGSPVKFRGVRVGSVEDITHVGALYDAGIDTPIPLECKRYVAVIMGLNRVENLGYREENLERLIQQRIAAGLRVRMASQGITGLAYMEVDYMEPGRYQPLMICWEPGRLYIPSAPSTSVRFTEAVDQILIHLEKVELTGVIARLERTLDLMADMIEKTDMPELGHEVRHTLAEIQDLKKRFEPLLDQVGPMLADASSTFETAREIAETSGEALKPLLERDIPETMNKLDALLENLEIFSRDLPATVEDVPDAVAKLKEMLGRMDGLLLEERQDIVSIMTNLRVISDNLREFSENAKRYPSQVLFGEPPSRKAPGEER
jgi:phospholipid/cholesterol/gamma-HCH transport system substrate-binding protein/paraquat-inducible protein B